MHEFINEYIADSHISAMYKKIEAHFNYLPNLLVSGFKCTVDVVNVPNVVSYLSSSVSSGMETT